MLRKAGVINKVGPGGIQMSDTKGTHHEERYFRVVIGSGGEIRFGRKDRERRIH